MSEPTLEQIAEFLHDAYVPLGTCSVLARELLALRKRADSNRDIVDHLYTSGSECEAEFRKRLDALERQARPYAEDGALAVSGACEVCDVLTETGRKLMDEIADARREVEHLREFKRVAHEALDHAGVVPFSAAKCRVVMRIDALSKDCDRVAKERDALARQLAESREALERHGAHDLLCPWQLGRPCTCGLSAALASTSKDDAGA